MPKYQKQVKSIYVYTYIYIYIHEEHTFQSGTCPLLVKNEPAMSCTRIVWHRIPFSHIQHPPSELSHVPYIVFND